MNTYLKRMTCLMMALCISVCFLPLADNGQVYAKSKKPGKPGTPVVRVTGNKATISWGAAKNATRYQVGFDIKMGKKWKKAKVATISRTTYTFSGKVKTTYRVKVRGVAKKKGKWSKKKKFTTGKTAAKPGVYHSTPVDASTRLTPGDTYLIKSPGGTNTVEATVTGIDIWKDTFQYGAKTKDGGTVYYSKTEVSEMYTYKAKNADSYFEIYGDADDNGAIRVKVKGDDVSYVWTLDGTEPQLGQEDLVGTSKYVHRHGELLNMQIRGFFDKTRKSGKYRDQLMDDPSIWWVKVYKGNKLIFEFKSERY